MQDCCQVQTSTHPTKSHTLGKEPKTVNVALHLKCRGKNNQTYFF